MPIPKEYLPAVSPTTGAQEPQDSMAWDKDVSSSLVATTTAEEAPAAPQEQAQDATGDTPLSNGDLAALRGSLDAIERAAAAGIQIGQDVAGQIEAALRTGKSSPMLNTATATLRGNEAEALVTQKNISEGLGGALAMAGGAAAMIMIPGAQAYSHIEGVKNAAAGFVAFFDKNADGTARTYPDKENPYATVETGETNTVLAKLDTFHTPRNQTALSQIPAIARGQSFGLSA
jgi:hypothetical protein